MTLPPTHRLLWGAIAACEGIGPACIRRCLKHNLTAEDVWNAPRALLTELEFSDKLIQRFLAWRSTFDVNEFAATLAVNGIDLLLKDDEHYPLALRTIHNPPEVLFTRGPAPPNTPSIAIIGTRRPTEYGKQVLQRFIGPLVQAGLPIISGLALGTDAEAHTMTLDAGGYTCGVLGSGVDDRTIYPSHNRALAKRLLEQGGCLLSEHPPGELPGPGSFPVRNRIIAGLAKAIVVIEAAIDSGTLITARAALEEGREVLAVPGSIWSDVSAGTHQLIRAGARLCADVSDIFEALNLDRVESCTKAQEVLPLTSDERELFEAMSAPSTADEISRAIDWSIGRVNQALSMLELKQLAVRLPNLTWGRA